MKNTLGDVKTGSNVERLVDLIDGIGSIDILIICKVGKCYALGKMIRYIDWPAIWLTECGVFTWCRPVWAIGGLVDQ